MLRVQHLIIAALLLTLALTVDTATGRALFLIAAVVFGIAARTARPRRRPARRRRQSRPLRKARRRG